MAKVACLVLVVSREQTKVIDICYLGKTLWSWTLCQTCDRGWQRGKHCTIGDCPSTRSKSLKRFFDYYMELIASHEPIFPSSERPVLSQHADILKTCFVTKVEAEDHSPRAGKEAFRKSRLPGITANSRTGTGNQSRCEGHDYDQLFDAKPFL